MREFRIDSPEFFVFKLEDKTYKIPLASSMPTKEIMEMSEAGNNTDRFFEWQLKMLKKYMGDIVDELPTGVASDILKAWSDANKKTGVDEGESSASSES